MLLFLYASVLFSLGGLKLFSLGVLVLFSLHSLKDKVPRDSLKLGNALMESAKAI